MALEKSLHSNQPYILRNTSYKTPSRKRFIALLFMKYPLLFCFYRKVEELLVEILQQGAVIMMKTGSQYSRSLLKQSIFTWNRSALRNSTKNGSPLVVWYIAACIYTNAKRGIRVPPCLSFNVCIHRASMYTERRLLSQVHRSPNVELIGLLKAFRNWATRATQFHNSDRPAVTL